MLLFTFLSMKMYGDGKPGRHLKGVHLPEHNKVMNRATKKEDRRKFQS